VFQHSEEGDVAITFFVVLQENNKKKEMTMLLPSPSLLRCNKIKGRRQQHRCCYRLLCCIARKQRKEGNGSVVAIAFFTVL
jgi:hypothetical protein